MEPDGHVCKAAETEIHLEDDIHALNNDPNGVPEDFWMPHLLIKYETDGARTDFHGKQDM